MSDDKYEEGQFVVYPAHGVGIIKGIETQNVAGDDIKVLVISFDKDKMIIRLPLNKHIKNKIRTLCSPEEMAEAVQCLKVPSRTKKMMWSRRAQEYEAKINSGVPISIAQVIRDLHRTTLQPEHSYSERQIYQVALDRLMREYAIVSKIDENQAMVELESMLRAA